MAQQSDDLSLGTGLIRKGEARGLSSTLAVTPKSEEPVTPPEQVPTEAQAPAVQTAGPEAALEHFHVE